MCNGSLRRVTRRRYPGRPADDEGRAAADDAWTFSSTQAGPEEALLPGAPLERTQSGHSADRERTRSGHSADIRGRSAGRARA